MYTLEQQKVNRFLWAKELRETEREQTTGFLFDAGCACANGIGYEVYMKITGDGQLIRQEYFCFSDNNTAMHTRFSKRVQEFYGNDGIEVTVWNDKDKMTFEEIANCVEAI